MRRLALLIAVLTTLLLSACHDNDTPAEQKPMDNAVLVYMPYTGPQDNLYSLLLQNVNDMKLGLQGTTLLKSNHLIIYMAQNPSRAVLFRLVDNGNSIGVDTLSRYNNPDPTTVGGIAGVLSEMKNAAQARTYSLIIGCHGEGWLPRKKTAAKPNGPRRYFGGTSYEYQTNMETLDSALNVAGLHLQYLLFDDCYVANVEDAYALRNSTDYLLGSTSEIMAKGLPYRQVIGHLMGKPDYQALCDGFYNYYSASATPYGTFSAINCHEVETMAGLMREANSRYQFDGDLSALQDLDADHWNPTIYFDFLSYARQLVKDDVLYNEISAETKKLVPYYRALPQIFSSVGNRAITLKSFSGISISDPSENPYATETKKRTGWWKATH